MVVKIENQLPGGLTEIANWNAGSPTGTDFAIIAGQGVIAEGVTSIAIPVQGAVTCPSISLQAGANIVGLNCIPFIDKVTNYSSFDLLRQLGQGYVSGIQMFDPVSNRFLYASFSGSTLVGSNFIIEPTRSYIIHVHTDLPAFDPLL